MTATYEVPPPAVVLDASLPASVDEAKSILGPKLLGKEAIVAMTEAYRKISGDKGGFYFDDKLPHELPDKKILEMLRNSDLSSVIVLQPDGLLDPNGNPIPLTLANLRNMFFDRSKPISFDTTSFTEPDLQALSGSLQANAGKWIVEAPITQGSINDKQSSEAIAKQNALRIVNSVDVSPLNASPARLPTVIELALRSLRLGLIGDASMQEGMVLSSTPHPTQKDTKIAVSLTGGRLSFSPLSTAKLNYGTQVKILPVRTLS